MVQESRWKWNLRLIKRSTRNAGFLATRPGNERATWRRNCFTVISVVVAEEKRVRKVPVL